jgi:UPF0176 protein
MYAPMTLLNIAGYKFIALNDLPQLRTYFLAKCTDLSLKGTILLSQEGINMSLAGSPVDIRDFQVSLRDDARFADMTFHENFASSQLFQRLKVKIKSEIITLRQPQANPAGVRAPDIDPLVFKQWLDEKRDVIVLDTRNDYEVRFGTFENAINLNINDFGEFPEAVVDLPKDKPIVMFCTGGIRCEKASLYMLNEGYKEVYQLDGGILGYFAKVGGAHYQGDCFVFDERVAVDAALEPTGVVQCKNCHGPVTAEQQKLSSYVPGVSCYACVRTIELNNSVNGF